MRPEDWAWWKGGEDAPAPSLPDGELLSLCREIAGCDRIADTARAYDVPVWDQPVAFKVIQGQLSRALRNKAIIIRSEELASVYASDLEQLDN